MFYLRLVVSFNDVSFNHLFAFLSLTQIVCHKGLYFVLNFDFVKSFLNFDLPKFMHYFCVLNLLE